MNTFEEYISTNCLSIDELLGGGIPRGQVTLIYGESHVGKTTFSLQCSISACRKGFIVLYFDCENGFSIDRLKQISFNEKVSAESQFIYSNILVSKPKTFHEQSILIQNLEKYISNKLILIVIDTISSIYRLELESSDSIFILNRGLNFQLACLNQLAKHYNLAILLTSQVHTKIGEQESKKIEPVATRISEFWSQNIIHMTFNDEKSLRKIILEKYFDDSKLGSFCFVKLDKNGLI